jgi:hypothetical protein
VKAPVFREGALIHLRQMKKSTLRRRITMLHKQILDYLTPLLGEATANNLLKHYCARMSMTAEQISPSHLPELASAMRPMLAVWLGSAGAAQVSDGIAQMGRGAAAK